MKLFSNKNHTSRRSVLIQWIISFGLIIVLAALLTGIVTFHYSKRLEKEIYETNAKALSEIKTGVEARLKDIEDIVLLIANSNNVKRFSHTSDPDSYPLTKVNEIIKDLSNYVSSNFLIDSIYIISHGTDMVIGPTTAYVGTIYTRFLDRHAFSDGTNFNITNNRRYSKEYVMLADYSKGRATYDEIGIVQTLPTDSPGKNNAALIIEVNRANLLNNINQNKTDSANNLFIIDPDDNIIASSSGIKLPEECTYEFLSRNPDNFSITYMGSSYTILQALSSLNSWRYVYIVPTGELLKETNRLTTVIWAITILTLIISAAIALRQIQSNYIPIQRLLSAFKDESHNSDASISDHGNEFDILESAAKKVLIERDELQKNADREQKLNDLMNRIDNEIVQDRMVEDAICYIEDNYWDPDLCVTMVSDSVGVSSSTLAKRFKAEYDVGIPDYINRYRCTKAMEMLKETDESISDICLACGYTNTNTFIRVFKKYEVVTPGKYRELNH